MREQIGRNKVQNPTKTPESRLSRKEKLQENVKQALLILSTAFKFGDNIGGNTIRFPGKLGDFNEGVSLDERSQYTDEYQAKCLSVIGWARDILSHHPDYTEEDMKLLSLGASSLRHNPKLFTEFDSADDPQEDSVRSKAHAAWSRLFELLDPQKRREQNKSFKKMQKTWFPKGEE